jgi:hypothetical protein
VKKPDAILVSPAGGIPLDVGAHEVLGLSDGLGGVCVDPLEVAAGALQVGEEEDAARRRPEEGVAWLALECLGGKEGGMRERGGGVAEIALNGTEAGQRTVRCLRGGQFVL